MQRRLTDHENPRCARLVVVDHLERAENDLASHIPEGHAERHRYKIRRSARRWCARPGAQRQARTVDQVPGDITARSTERLLGGSWFKSGAYNYRNRTAWPLRWTSFDHLLARRPIKGVRIRWERPWEHARNLGIPAPRADHQGRLGARAVTADPGRGLHAPPPRSRRAGLREWAGSKA